MKDIIKALFLILLVLPGAAYAEDCRNLDTDPKWKADLVNVKKAIESEKWEEALAQSRELYRMCQSSPILNYYVARSLQGSGDIVKAHVFYEKAAELTTKIGASNEDARLIWYARYEAEHPERTDMAMRESNIHEEELKVKIDEKDRALHAYMYNDLTERKDTLKKGIWSGIGIGLTGLAVTIAGGVLAFTGDDETSSLGSVDTCVDGGSDGEGKNCIVQTVTPSKKKTAGYGLFGAGLVMTVAGAAVTGIFGYQYTHLKADGVELSFDIAPQSASLTVKF